MTKGAKMKGIRGAAFTVALIATAALTVSAAGESKEWVPAAVAVPETEEFAATEQEDTATEATVAVGYDFEKVCKIVYHEAGNSAELQRAVATCIANACDKTLLNPEEVCEAYRYTTPWQSCPESCEEICIDVLILGRRSAAVGAATLFYAPKYAHGTWHETQRFVAEVCGMRFFEEVK